MSIRAYNPPVSPTPATVDFAQRAIHEFDRPGAAFALIDRNARKGQQPSDHAPVIADFEERS